MTLKNRCVTCDHVIEAPDSMRGQEIACPQCEATNVLLSVEDARRREAGSQAGTNRERQAFMSSLASKSGSKRRQRSGWRPAIDTDGPAPRDLALLAARRLKNTSIYLLFFAYVLLLVSLASAMGVLFWDQLTFTWKAIGAGACVFFGVFVFVVFKLLSDTIQAVADLTDLGRSVDARVNALQAKLEPQPVVSEEDMAGAQPPAGEVLSPRG